MSDKVKVSLEDDGGSTGYRRIQAKVVMKMNRLDAKNLLQPVLPRRFFS